MAYEPTVSPALPSDDTILGKLLREKKAARDFQERRHKDWDENYQLYRNKVLTNRLTQRQAVNIPLMKETIKTLLSKIDEAPAVDWKELSGDQKKEIIFQEIWNHAYEEFNFEGIDIQDKKSVMLYGRGFKKLNWVNGQAEVTALDIYDIVVDPLTDPLDIETARYVVHQNIFKPLREILADERYETKAKEALKAWLMSPAGIVQSGKNKEEYEKKLERLRAMGVQHDEFPMFAAGDVLVHLNEHYTEVWDKKAKKFVRRVYVVADDCYVLLDDTLKNLIGIEVYPFVTWSEDIETSDFWSDGPADLVRVPNQVINVWFSQLVENRTLKNFQMHWYDATKQGYKPQTYEPGPGRMLPAPGNPSEVIMPVDISGLDDTLTAVDFVIKVVERGSSATAIEKGTSERKNITLGEVETLVGKAMERTLAMAKFYRRSWQELAMKWYQLTTENASKKITLYKTSRKGKIWPKTVYPSDWKSEAGFKAFVRSSSEQEEDKIKSIQRFQFVLQQFPNNSALKRIAQKRMLEVVDLTAEEIREITEEEKRVEEMMLKQQQMEQQLAAAQQSAEQAENPSAPAEDEMAGPMDDLASALDTRGAQEKLMELQAL